MDFEYFSPEEYDSAFVHFGGIREKIAHLVVSLCGLDSMRVLDLLAGHGYLSVEISKSSPGSKIVAIGLPNDAETHLQLRKQLTRNELFSNIDYVCTDATELPFAENSFDLVVNFLGLEDLMMTRGTDGIRKALTNLTTLVTKGGFLQISMVEYGDTPEEQIAKEVWDPIGLGCTFLPESHYTEVLESLGLRLLNSVIFHFPRKMTSDQAREELEFACNKAPIIFEQFGVDAISFEKLWHQFGDRIEEHGLAYWSRLRVLVFRKV